MTPGSLPADAALLPLLDGDALLVSRSHAVYCRVPVAEARALQGLLDGMQPMDALGSDLQAALERHGVFGPPRPPRADPPSVQLQLTNACNLQCDYCCTNSGAPRARELTGRVRVEAVESVRHWRRWQGNSQGSSLPLGPGAAGDNPGRTPLHGPR